MAPMETHILTYALYGLGALALVGSSGARLKRRLELSLAKHPSLTGHARMARRIAALIPFYEYDESRFFSSDDAPHEIAARRRAGFARLAKLYEERFAKTRLATAKVKDVISDLQFTDAYRVPFQYSRIVRESLSAGTFVQSSVGRDAHRPRRQPLLRPDRLLRRQRLRLRLLQGLHGARPAPARASWGPCSGSYHPLVAYNVRAAASRSPGLDEVSFHMSGTEAVMQAVRLARYHTRRTHLVRFSGAYHGWWGDVQPGVGNPVPARETYTLQDMSERTLHVLRTRRDIACVLVNPSQAMHPNAGPAGDSALVDSARGSHFDKAAYADWLKRLRAVCTERGIVLIFDEVFVGFRLAPGGAQEYFGVQGRHGDLRQDAGRRLAGRRALRPRRPDEALPRRPPGRHLLRPRHLQLAPRRDGRDGGVPGAHRDARRSVQLYNDLDAVVERARRAPEPAPRRGRPAGAGGQHVVDLDRALHQAFALQLDAPVLPARRGPGAELDRHRPPDLQPQLHRGRLRGRRRPLRRRRQGHGRRTAGGGPPRRPATRRSAGGYLREIVAHRLRWT